MIHIIPEAFLGSCGLFLLVCGSILKYSPIYNHPIICFKSITFLILFWAFLLLKGETTNLNLQAYNSLIYFVNDNLSLNAKIIIILGLIGCTALSQNKITKILVFEYYVLILFALLGLFCLSSSFDFLSIYLSLELQSLSFYILACIKRRSVFSTEAGLKYFLLGAISSSFLLFGISFIYGFSGTTNIESLYYLFLDSTSTNNDILYILIKIGFFFFSFGLIFKLGLVPFHIWVADVYEGAPTYVTAIFAVLPKIALFIVFIRLFKITSPNIWQTYALSLGLLSAILGALGALAQTKFKRLLAFSGISHLGYVIIGLSCGTIEGFQACLFYILIYMATSIFFWGLALSVEDTKSRTLYLSDIINWVKTNPYLGFTTILVAFSLAGIPPLGGFFAKFAVFAASANASFYLATLVGLLSSAIGILYYLRLVKVIAFEDTGWYTSRPFHKIHVFTMGCSSFFLIFFVFYGDFVLYFIHNISLSI